ncbi:hypothetical protein KFL_004290040 [Klebsormidium nitens]|uniref:BES1/BZR1 plant transcription factor N-terminal domain-containing protein n=1 Tax=Klebsormidium nitens TaxID=105231 RepID=A0A1Y1IIG4_KLENI|nr:hypothetical protein KFL_004290040 [Klebsormidium nitens]|eukprot:GAQ88447.1 hypothetical protein KFL_004290040 [Klebsormidium nitens]
MLVAMHKSAIFGSGAKLGDLSTGQARWALWASRERGRGRGSSRVRVMATDGATDPKAEPDEQPAASSRIKHETQPPPKTTPVASQLPNSTYRHANTTPPGFVNSIGNPPTKTIDTAGDIEVKSEGAVQLDVSNLPSAVPFEIPVVEGKHRSGQSGSQPAPIHIPRYRKSNRPVDWKLLPPTSMNSRLIAEQQGESVNGLLPGGLNGFLPGGLNGPLLSSVNGPLQSSVNSPVLPRLLMAGIHHPTSPYAVKAFENQTPSGLNSPRDSTGVNRPSAGEEPRPAALQQQLGVNSPKTEPRSANNGSVAQQTDSVNSHQKGHQRPILPAQPPGASHVAGAQGMPQPPMMMHPQHPNLYTVAGSFPNLSFSPTGGPVPAPGQVLQLNFSHQTQQYAPSSGTNPASTPTRRPPNMIGEVPKAKDAEKRRDRERVRRAIMANIISGLRNYGGYGLPSTAPDIEYIRALLREAGYVTHIDGTTYRRGAVPPVNVEPIIDAGTSSREDYGAQDTPPSTSMRGADQANSFRQEAEGNASDNQPGEEDNRDDTGADTDTEEMTGGDNRGGLAGGGGESGMERTPGEGSPVVFSGRGNEIGAERRPGEENHASKLEDELLEGGLGKRLLEFVNGGADAKKLRSS